MSAGWIADGPDAVRLLRLLALKSAVSLESKGLRTSRRSMTAQARREFGLRRNAPHADVIAAIEAECEAMHARGIGFERIGQ